MTESASAHASGRGGKPKRAIVLSGGGARGAYEAGVLRFILDDLPKRTGVQPDFEIICGTSVGAIHACFLAATADEDIGRGDHLVEIWHRMKVHEIFEFTTADFFKLPRRMLGVKRVAQQLREGQRPDRLYGLLDTEPLERLVLQSIPWRGIRRNLRTGRIDTVCVAATQIATGRAVVFCDSNRPELPPWASDAQHAHAAHPALAAPRPRLGRDPAALPLRARRRPLLRRRRTAAEHAPRPGGASRRRPKILVIGLTHPVRDRR